MASYYSSHHHFYGGDTAASSSGGAANYNYNLFPPPPAVATSNNNELEEEENDQSTSSNLLFSPTVAAIRNKPHTISHSIFSPQPPATSATTNSTVRDKENAVPTPQHANKTPTGNTTTSAWSLLQSATKTKPVTPFPRASSAHASAVSSPYSLTEFHTPAQTATPFGGLKLSSSLLTSSFEDHDNDEEDATTDRNNRMLKFVLASPYKSLPSLQMMTTEYIDNCFDLNTLQHIVNVLKNNNQKEGTTTCTYPYLLKYALQRYNELQRQQEQEAANNDNDIIAPPTTTTTTTPSNQQPKTQQQYRYHRAPTPYVKHKFNTAVEDSLDDEDEEEDHQLPQQRQQQPYHRAPTPYVKHKFNTDHQDSRQQYYHRAPTPYVKHHKFKTAAEEDSLDEEEGNEDDDNNQQQQYRLQQRIIRRAPTPYVKRNKFAEDSLELSCSDDDSGGFVVVENSTNSNTNKNGQQQEGVRDVDCSADSSNPVIALTGYRTKSAYKPNHIFRRTSTTTPAVVPVQQQTHQQHGQQPSSVAGYNSAHAAAVVVTQQQKQQVEELAHELERVTQQLQELQAVHARDQQHHKEQIETLERAKIDAQNKYQDALELCDETSNEYQKALDQYKQQCAELQRLYRHEKQSNQQHREKVGQLSRRIDELTKELDEEKKKCSTNTDWERKHKGLHELLKSSQQNLRNVQDERDTILRSLVVQVDKNNNTNNIKKLSKEERTKLLGNLIRQIVANQSAVKAMAETVNTAEMDRNKAITKYRKLKQLLSQGKEMNDQLLYEQSHLKKQLQDLKKESKTWKIKTNQIHQSAQKRQQQQFQKRELDYKNTIQSLQTQLTMVETTMVSRDKYLAAIQQQDSQQQTAALAQKNEYYENQIHGLNRKLSHLEKELKQQQQKQQPSSTKLATKTTTMKNQQRSKSTFALPASRIPLPSATTTTTTTTTNPPPPPLQKVPEKTAASTTKKTPPRAACPPPPPPPPARQQKPAAATTTTPNNNKNLLLRASSSLRKAGGGISRKAMEEKVRLARSRSPKPRQPLQNLQN